MVQMDLVDWMEARARRMRQDEPAAEPALPARRGARDAAGRLYAVLTRLPEPATLGDYARVLDDHEAILTDASRFGG